MLRQVDQDLFDICTDEGLQLPIFTTSWILTKLAHCIDNFNNLQRIYDFILANHPLMIIHLSVSIILEYTDEIMEQAEEYQSSVCYVVFHKLKRLNDENIVEKIEDFHIMVQSVEIAAINNI